MNKPLSRALLAGLLLAAVSCSSSETAPSAPAVASNHYRGQSAMLNFTFTVEAIDAAKRSITLKSPDGGTGSYIVGEEVKRFSEIKVGDTIVVQYHVGVFAEFRKPKPEEEGAPVVISQSTSRAPSDVPATGAITRTVKVATTVDSVDAQAQTITLKGPLGNKVTFTPVEKATLGDVKPGQHILATFAEQIVLAHEPKK